MAEQRNQTPAGDNTQWTTIIRPRTGWFDVDLEELWRYRDLIVMFVKRNFTVMYKQTILGPLWIILNPLITTVLFNVVFGGIAGLSTDGTPSFLFYMAGNTVWTFFASCINGTANTFVANSQVFGKVYFPRLTTPISQVLTSLINFFIQFVMYILFWVYFAVTGSGVHLTAWAFAVGDIVIDVVLEVLQAGGGGAHHPVAHAKGVQNVQGRHIQDSDALGIVRHFQLRRLLVGIEAGDGHGLGGLVVLCFFTGLAAAGRGGILGRIAAVLRRAGHKAQGHHTGQGKRKHLFHVHFWLLLF